MNMTSMSGPSVSSSSGGSISRTAGITDRSEPGQPALNVGIASRLVNQEQHNPNFPLRFHDAYSGPRFLITPHQFGHIPVGYTVIPQPCTPFLPAGISTAQALQLFPGLSAGMRPVMPSHISTFDAASLFAPYLTQHIPLLTGSAGPAHGDGAFQYPLHHLTGTTGAVSVAQNITAAFRVPDKSAALPNTSGSPGRVSSSSLIISQSSHQQDGPEDTVEGAESTGRVLPVHIFDNDSDPPLVAPQDLSSENCDRSVDSNSLTKSRGPRRFTGPVRPGAKRHKHTRPHGGSSVGGNACENSIASLLLAAQTKPQTEMQHAAKEWSTSADAKPDDLDPDCWDFLQRFKEKQRRLDTTFIETRSVFSTLTAEQREKFEFAVPRDVPDALLQQCRIIKKNNNVKDSITEKIIESADVDPNEMRQFVRNLTQSAADIGPKSADEEAAVLCAVGLVENAQARSSSAHVTSASTNKSKNSRTESRKRSRPDSSPRQNIRRELEDALVQLTTQMVDLKRKVNAVKKLVKDEVSVSDSEIPNISKELQRILSNK